MHRLTRSRLAALAALAALSLATACAPGPPPTTQGPHPVLFVLEADPEEPGPIFVQVNTESRPVGWLTLLRDGERVHFVPRCEVPDCGEPAEAVCGAALPRVRDLAADTAPATMEFTWDGYVGRKTDHGCEIREPASAGQYVARFCHGRTLRTFGPTDEAADPTPSTTRLGYVEHPECVDRAVTVPGDEQVRVTVPSRQP